MRWISFIALGVAACGGALEPTTTDDRGSKGAVAAAEEAPAPARASRTTTSIAAPSGPARPPPFHPQPAPPASAPGVSCQVFEPGGPERWGCHTIDLAPELACEHAAGADIARCNCIGRFGEDAPGQPTGVEWIDIPATSVFFTDARMFELWKLHCAE